MKISTFFQTWEVYFGFYNNVGILLYNDVGRVVPRMVGCVVLGRHRHICLENGCVYAYSQNYTCHGLKAGGRERA